MDEEFQEAYLEESPECIIHFSHLNPPTSIGQVKRDVTALYGALTAACEDETGMPTFIKHEKSRDGIRVWRDILDDYHAGGDIDTRITLLEGVVNTPYHRKFPGGLEKWIRDYESAFAEMAS